MTSHTSTSTPSSQGVTPSPMPKLPSCDACRMRRIRCDRASTSLEDPCLQCRKRDLRCTLERKLSNGRKYRRDGEVVALARQKFGSGAPADGTVHGTGAGLKVTVTAIAEQRAVKEVLTKAMRNVLVQEFLSSTYTPLHLYPWQKFYHAFNTDTMTQEQESLSQVVLATACRSSKLLAERKDIRAQMWESTVAMCESRGILKGNLGTETLAMVVLLMNACQHEPGYITTLRLYNVLACEQLKIYFENTPAKDWVDEQERSAYHVWILTSLLAAKLGTIPPMCVVSMTRV
ncbi:hypothetical protein BT69DRAFT_454157 [Atractiella rhizophila]|nr:hypothetical protein BT69DRAFT_454157 [Atractiella rhizophila]